MTIAPVDVIAHVATATETGPVTALATHAIAAAAR